MKIPEGYTENEVVEIIETIGSRLANKFRFGYYEIDDMKQEAALFAWEALPKYDGVRPLENFLWIHVRNRLFNLKRNNYARPDLPCDKCPLDALVNKRCTLYQNLSDCEYYHRWEKRNEVKKNLMSTKESYDLESPNLALDDHLLSKELYQIVNTNIPLDLRQDWIRFSNKLKLPKVKRDNLLEAIFEILKQKNINIEDLT